MRRFFKLVCVMTLLGTAQTGLSGIYLGAGIGSVEPDLSSFTKDVYGQVYLGAEFGRWFAIEAGYHDFGESESADGQVTLEAEGLSAAAVGRVPIWDLFEIYGRLGFLHWDRDAKVGPGTIDEIKEVFDESSTDGFDATYGLGLLWNLTGSLAVSLEWARQEMDDADLDTYGARLTLRL